MLEATWLIESAIVAGPLAGASALRWHRRNRLRSALNAPIAWEGGRPISLQTLFNELNGEADLMGLLVRDFGLARPVGPGGLEHLVATLRRDAAARRRLILALALATALHETTMPVDEVAALMTRLEAALAAGGIFTLLQALSGARHGAPLVPLAAVVPGGLPIAPDTGAPWPTPPLAGGAIRRLLSGWTDGPWLPQVAQAVGDMMRHWHVRQAREAFEQALIILGRQVDESFRHPPRTGSLLFFNVFASQDPYLILETRVAGQLSTLARDRWIRVSPERLLLLGLKQAADETARVMTAKCLRLHEILRGKQGLLAAGEVLYFHRSTLLKGVEPGAFAIAAAEAAEAAYRQALMQPEAPWEPS